MRVAAESSDWRVARARHRGVLGPVIKPTVKLGCFLCGQRGVQPGGVDVAGGEGIDLVFHQGDERRDHQGESVEEESWELVAKRLSASGGEDCEGGPIGEERFDDR